MNTRNIPLLIAIGLAGLVAGFLLANAVNRNEISTLRAETEQLRKSGAGAPPSNTDSNNTLSDEEINATIQRADQNPNDFQIQRSLGIALYRYSASKQNVALLQQSVRILERAVAIKPDDYDVTITLGNGYFDIGYFSKNNESLTKAREIYAKGLATKPGDVEVQTDVGLTYFLQTPPELESAAREFKKSLDKNPSHEKTLQLIIQTLAQQQKTAEANQYLEKLRTVNPRNPSIPELTGMVNGSGQSSE